MYCNKLVGISGGLYSGFNFGIIKRKNNYWEWDMINFPKNFYENRVKFSSESFVQFHKDKHYDLPTFALNVSYNTLDAKGLKSYIQAFEKILKLEPSEELTEFPIEWLSNEAEFRFRARRVSSEEIGLEIKCKNKYRLTYDEFDMGPFGGGDPEDYGREVISEYNGKPEEYCQMGYAKYPEKNIREYLEELIKEYEDATGEEYERLIPKPSKLKFWKK